MLLKAEALKKTLKQTCVNAIQNKPQVAIEVSPPKPDNADKRKQLESRLRIIDLQIEREEILNSLAALK